MPKAHKETEKKKEEQPKKEQPLMINTINLDIIADKKKPICRIKEIGMKHAGEFQFPVKIRGTVKDKDAGALQRKLDMMAWELGRLKKTSEPRVYKFVANIRDDTVIKFFDKDEGMVARIRMRAIKDGLVTVHKITEAERNGKSERETAADADRHETRSDDKPGSDIRPTPRGAGEVRPDRKNSRKGAQGNTRLSARSSRNVADTAGKSAKGSGRSRDRTASDATTRDSNEGR